MPAKGSDTPGSGQEWLRLLPEPVNFRYDVVEVLYREGKPPEFRHIRGAFGAKDLYVS